MVCFDRLKLLGVLVGFSSYWVSLIYSVVCMVIVCNVFEQFSLVGIRSGVGSLVVLLVLYIVLYSFRSSVVLSYIGILVSVVFREAKSQLFDVVRVSSIGFSVGLVSIMCLVVSSNVLGLVSY